MSYRLFCEIIESGARFEKSLKSLIQSTERLFQEKNKLFFIHYIKALEPLWDEYISPRTQISFRV
ncbi:MAG: hypothetical protein ACI8RA_001726 [Chlamydiales bacterium]|jgi:hypothetical protein